MQGKEPEVWLVEFGDSSVNYWLLVWVAHYGVRRPNRIKSYYMWELDNAFNKYNIEIPFPKRDVNLNVVDKSDKKAMDSVLSEFDSSMQKKQEKSSENKSRKKKDKTEH